MEFFFAGKKLGERLGGWIGGSGDRLSFTSLLRSGRR